MKTKVMVSGFGFMGQTHLCSLLKMPDVAVTGIIDPCDPAERIANIKGNNETESVRVEDITGIPHYRTMADALQGGQADAVVIALPTQLHTTGVLQALQAGLHVFVEKPFAIQLSECAEMVRCARDRQKILAVGYVMRAQRNYLLLKEAIDSGRLGKLKFLKMTRITGIPNWGKWKDPATLKASGGGLFDLLSHDVDFIRFCLGTPESIESNRGLGRGQFQMISAILHYPDADAMVEGGFVTPCSFPFNAHYEAYFEKGNLLSEGDGATVIEQREGESKTLSLQEENPYFIEMERFIHAVRTGDDSGICSIGEDAMKTIECCTVIQQKTSP